MLQNTSKKMNLKYFLAFLALEFFDLMELASIAFSMDGYASFRVILNSSLYFLQFFRWIIPLVWFENLWKVISQEKSSNFLISDNRCSWRMGLTLKENPFSLFVVSFSTMWLHLSFKIFRSLKRSTSLLVSSRNWIWQYISSGFLILFSSCCNT